ncbi:MAG: hypothetical protein JF616_15110 [Fibrobacteres bacterium]|nr:hypothetical protein [Fibrobacterota bacterium]
MGTGKVSKSVGYVLCLFCISPLAQTRIDISGKVTDQTGKGLAGVTVTLKINKASANTAADGAYHLDGSSSNAIRPAKQGTPVLAFNDRMLEFTVPDDYDEVRIAIHDLTGRSIASVLDSRLAKGSYRINPFVADLESRLAILSVKIGAESNSMKMFGTGDRSVPAGVPHRVDPPASASLRKPAADPATDTLSVSKPGWSSDDLTLDSLTGTHDFLLVRPEIFWGDPAAYPAATNVMTYVFLNRTNGKYTDDQVFWSFGNQTHSVAEQPFIDMPANSSGRVNFHLETATGKYADFIEHTISPTVWNGNTTRVDGFGIPIAIRLICGDGTDQMLGEKYDVFYKGRDAFFKAYKNAVPAEFYPTAETGAPYRIIAPGKGDGGFNVGQKYAAYYDGYLKELGITGATTNQVFACEGTPFGSDAQLAGAVNRHVAHLPKAEWLKAENFYKQAPANYYAKFFHERSFQKKAYGFAYDDAAGYAAYASCSKPKYLLVAIGF